jgi:hypothetical protein
MMPPLQQRLPWLSRLLDGIVRRWMPPNDSIRSADISDPVPIESQCLYRGTPYWCETNYQRAIG